jgi:hypothetical protein
MIRNRQRRSNEPAWSIGSEVHVALVDCPDFEGFSGSRVASAHSEWISTDFEQVCLADIVMMSVSPDRLEVVPDGGRGII